MKRLVLALFIIYIAPLVLAQTGVVTGTATDSDGQAWINGTWGYEFFPNPNYPSPSSYTINGVPLTNYYTAPVTGTLDSSGNLVATGVPRTDMISPIGSQWKFKICPKASSSCGTFNVATSATTNVTSAISSAITAPRFQATHGTYGYNDTEATIPIPVGGTYWNVVSLCQRYFNGTSWNCGGATVPGVASDGANGLTIQGNTTINNASQLLLLDQTGSTTSQGPVSLENFTTTYIGVPDPVTSWGINEYHGGLRNTGVPAIWYGIEGNWHDTSTTYTFESYLDMVDATGRAIRENYCAGNNQDLTQKLDCLWVISSLNGFWQINNIAGSSLFQLKGNGDVIMPGISFSGSTGDIITQAAVTATTGFKQQSSSTVITLPNNGVYLTGSDVNFDINLNNTFTGAHAWQLISGGTGSVAPAGGLCWWNGSQCNWSLDFSGNLSTPGNTTVHSGTNTVYRCTTAGTLPVGALTINTSNCGASADTGLRVN